VRDMPTVTLRPTDLHWLKRGTDDPQDLCAHSPVEFRVAGQSIVEPSDGDWSVNAAALYLLRTLSRPHTKDSPVGDHLFPCCGFTLLDLDGQDDVLIQGCLSGVDVQVARVRDQIALTAQDGRQHVLAFSEWRRAVCTFSDAVRSFYARSQPREPFDEEERKGFRKMMQEWDRRRSLADTQS